MGVGVYGSDFGGNGTSFLTSGPIGTEEDYEAYRKACLDDGVTALDREEWERQEYDDENTLLVDTATHAAAALGLTAASRKGFRSDRADFDRDISSLAAGGMVEVGWRSWEHDFVVAVGPTDRAAALLGMDAADLAAEAARSPDGLRGDYEALVAVVAEYVRIELQRNAVECRYRTSGYTTRTYDEAAEPDKRLAELKAEAAELSRRLDGTREQVFPLLDTEERVAVLKAVEPSEIVFPVIVGDGGAARLALYSAADPDGDGCAQLSSWPVPETLGGFVAAPSNGAVVAVPRGPQTRDWFAARQAAPREFHLVASAEEVAEVMGEDVAVRVAPSASDPDLATQVVVAQAPAPAPAP